MAIRDELKHFKKERILEEAERLFYERGFRGTSLDAIAESLDMTKPFIYGAYERKLDILIDIYERAMNRALDAIRGARAAGGTPVEQLRRFATTYTGVVIANQAGTAVFFREEPSIPEEAVRRINDLKGRFDAELAALIVAGVEAAAFRVDDPRAATLAIGGMISWAYVWYRPGGRLTPEEIGEQMATYTLRIVGASDAGY